MMKNKMYAVHPILRSTLSALVVAVFVLYFVAVTKAQLIQSRNVISYQGSVQDASGAHMKGERQFIVTLYADPAGQAKLWEGKYSQIANNGAFNLMVGNGLPIFPATLSNAFEVSYNGHSTVFHNNTSVPPSIEGSTYTDNVLYAWGHVDPDADFPLILPPGPANPAAMANATQILLSSTRNFGVDWVKLRRLSTGVYEYIIKLKVVDVDGNDIDLSSDGCSITATPVYTLDDSQFDDDPELWNQTSALPKRFIAVSEMVSGNRFRVWVSALNCTTGECDDAYALPFMFKVTGRPVHGSE